MLLASAHAGTHVLRRDVQQPGQSTWLLPEVWPRAGRRGCATRHQLSATQRKAVPVSRWAEATYRELPAAS